MDDQRSSSAHPEDAMWNALARFQAGESDAAEAAEVERWLAAHPLDAAALSALNRAVDRVRASDAAVRPIGDVDVNSALRAVKARVGSDNRRLWSTRSPRSPRSTRSIGAPTAGETWTVRPLAVAAGFAAAAALVIGLAVNRSTHLRQTAASAGSPPHSYATAVGARQAIVLTDGTRVELGPASSLSVAAGYGAGHRDVSLEGEAYFVAVHDDRAPFTVHVDGATMRDAGTAFDVRADVPGVVRVAVDTGTVVLRSAADSTAAVTLQAHDIGVVDGAAARRLPQRLPTGSSWNANQLVFDDAPMAEVRATLHRWYGVNVTVDSSVADRHVSAQFTGESAAHVVDVIARTIGATAEWRNGSVVMHDGLAGRRVR